MDLYYLKYKICLLLFDENDENIKNNISLEQIILSIKSNQDFKYLINSTKKDNYLRIIKEQYLEIHEFKIINLPENGLEFLNKANNECCLYCKKKNLSSYLCPLCGIKICNDKYCFIKNISKRGDEYSLIYHSKKCCGRNGIFVDIQNSEIIYISKRRIIKSNIFIYMNEFGESLKNNFMNDEYKLNKDELNKGIMKFNDMTYRKKVMKIYEIRNYIFY